MEGTLLLDPITLKMTIRKGDTGSVCFRLNRPAENCFFWFVVKESIFQSDSDAPIYQKYDHVGGSLLLLTISEEESDRLSAKEPTISCCNSSGYRDYIWAIKYAEKILDDDGNFLGTSSVKTLVPKAMRKPPIFRVYPEIIEGPHV